ncbi:Sorting nexin-4 [Acropora cervicornis]|uniref:Sorting nexin-4 n=1 Tax=Acropora cervicornis TaxID=6130 RepID=A0AAD9QZJ8_ACRCE|nr:Sorting nexin-4 [Acropora cervicornis]
MADDDGAGKTQYFPEGSMLNTLIISIVDFEKRFTDILKEPYIVYLIETKYIDGGPPAGEPDLSSSIWRRYIVPPLPEKRINIAALRIAADKFDPDFIEKRKAALEVDSRLKSWSASAKEPDRRFEDMKHYGDNLGSNVAAMIKVRQYLREQNGGWTTEIRMAASVDETLQEDEMNFSEQLKEYLLFADVLKGVAHRQQLRQYDVEKAEENLANKTAQRDDLIAQKEALESGKAPAKSGGFSFKGLSSMIFGAESSEVLTAKIGALDEQIIDAEETVKATKEDLRLFNEEAVKDYDRFRRQEVRDLRKVLTTHIKTQMALCKMGISTWEEVRDTAKKL